VYCLDRDEKDVLEDVSRLFVKKRKKQGENMGQRFTLSDSCDRKRRTGSSILIGESNSKAKPANRQVSSSLHQFEEEEDAETYPVVPPQPQAYPPSSPGRPPRAP
jgi:hypothetical protein